MIDKNRVLRVAEKFIERAERYISDAEERRDDMDMSHYEGQKKLAEEFKSIVEKW